MCLGTYIGVAVRSYAVQYKPFDTSSTPGLRCSYRKSHLKKIRSLSKRVDLRVQLPKQKRQRRHTVARAISVTVTSLAISTTSTTWQVADVRVILVLTPKTKIPNQIQGSPTRPWIIKASRYQPSKTIKIQGETRTKNNNQKDIGISQISDIHLYDKCECRDATPAEEIQLGPKMIGLLWGQKLTSVMRREPGQTGLHIRHPMQTGPADRCRGCRIMP